MSGEVVVWRIGADTPDYQAHDLNGKGAEISGGRWNRRGTPLVYASSSRALACLETLVHLAQPALPLNRYLVEVTVPEQLWQSATIFDSAARVGWDAEPTGAVSLDWGTAWAKSEASVLALVPSVIVEEEMNVLLNPAHPDASRVRGRKVRRWRYGQRLVAR